MKAHARRKLLLMILLASSAFSAFFYYKNEIQPQELLLKNTSYFLPGQNKKCQWILQLENTLRDIPGDSSAIRIAIPSAQAYGYVGGRIEVAPHKNLILAFIPPGARTHKMPVVLTAGYEDAELPLKHIRFRWVRSSVLTVVLFRDRDSCLKFGNQKQ